MGRRTRKLWRPSQVTEREAGVYVFEFFIFFLVCVLVCAFFCYVILILENDCKIAGRGFVQCADI